MHYETKNYCYKIITLCYFIIVSLISAIKLVLCARTCRHSQLVPVVCVVEFSAAENQLTPYSDDSLSLPDISKCDETIDVVAVDRRVARTKITWPWDATNYRLRPN